MNYLQIYKDEICNGQGIGVSIFVSGCPLRCKGCFNQVAWDFNSGKSFTEETIDKILESADHEYINRLSILGGEPLAEQNVTDVCNLIVRFKMEYPDKKIWLYTGYTYEELQDRINKATNTCDEWLLMILHNIDVLVDGRFDYEQRDLTLKFRGSRNQRLIDMNETIKNKKLTLMQIN